jgi:hypothetical protein
MRISSKQTPSVQFAVILARTLESASARLATRVPPLSKRQLAVRPVPVLPILPRLSAKPVSPHYQTYTVDGALKLDIKDKERSHHHTDPNRPPSARAKPRRNAGAAPHSEPAHEGGGAGRPKCKAASAPATENLVSSRGKKVETDTAEQAAAAPDRSQEGH